MYFYFFGQWFEQLLTPFLNGFLNIFEHDEKLTWMSSHWNSLIAQLVEEWST